MSLAVRVEAEADREFWIEQERAQIERAKALKTLERSCILRAERKAREAERSTWGNSWHPACGGTETPFKTRAGRILLYVWQPSTGRHAYLDTQTDLILTDDEARNALAV